MRIVMAIEIERRFLVQSNDRCTEVGVLCRQGSRPLEAGIDELNRDLPELRNFILPGGHPAAAALHVARTVCRRVERRAVGLRETEAIPDGVIVYLNRLSDFLFVAARWANRVFGQQDVLWSADRDAQEESPS